ncbi:hypothetical protein NL676_020201 [Syzygium grande]|nr:hypothetical protein NL676_020201 [Syzygium grande]
MPGISPEIPRTLSRRRAIHIVRGSHGRLAFSALSPRGGGREGGGSGGIRGGVVRGAHHGPVGAGDGPMGGGQRGPRVAGRWPSRRWRWRTPAAPSGAVAGVQASPVQAGGFGPFAIGPKFWGLGLK